MSLGDRPYRGGPRRGLRSAAPAAALTAFLALGGAFAVRSAAETAATAATSAAAPPARSLTIEQAVASGLANDPGIRSGNWDLVSARAKAQDAKYRMLPSLSASVGYTQLSPTMLCAAKFTT